MSIARLVQTTCTECAFRWTYGGLHEAQDGGWLSIDVRPIGSSPEHDRAHSYDLCPNCARSFRRALEHDADA